MLEERGFNSSRKKTEYLRFSGDQDSEKYASDKTEKSSYV